MMAFHMCGELRRMARLTGARPYKGRRQSKEQFEHMIRYHSVWWVVLLALADASAIEAHIAAGRYREALTSLQQQGSRNAMWHVLASKAHDGLGDPAKAVAEAETALKLEPRNEAAHVQLGYIFLSRNTPAAAVDIFSDAERLLPSSLPVRLGKGLALKDLQRWDEAERVLADCWPHPVAFDALSTVLLHRSKFARTKALAIQFIAAQPNDYRGHYYLAAAKDGLQEADAAAHARESLQRKPDFAAAHALLGKIALRNGSLPEAIQSLRAATKLRPDLTQAHLQLGQALQRTGQAEEAAREFAIVRDLKRKEAEPKPSLLYHRGGH